MAWRTLIPVAALVFCWACNSPLAAPSKRGPAPEYEDPSAAEAAAPPLNPRFEDEARALFENEGGQALHECQKQAEAAGKLEGTLQVHLVLRPDGGVVVIEPRNDSGLPPSLSTCLVSALGRLKFPAPGGERNLALELPLRFMAEPEASGEGAGGHAP